MYPVLLSSDTCKREVSTIWHGSVDSLLFRAWVNRHLFTCIATRLVALCTFSGMHHGRMMPWVGCTGGCAIGRLIITVPREAAQLLLDIWEAWASLLSTYFRHHCCLMPSIGLWVTALCLAGELSSENLS